MQDSAAIGRWLWRLSLVLLLSSAGPALADSSPGRSQDSASWIKDLHLFVVVRQRMVEVVMADSDAKTAEARFKRVEGRWLLDSLRALDDAQDRVRPY